MFRFRSIRTEAARLAAAISIISLLFAFILSISSVLTGANFTLAGSGSLHIPGSGAIVSVVLLLILMSASYSMVYKRIGWIKFGATNAAILLAIVEVILGFEFLGLLVLLGGIFLFVAWFILEI